MATLREVRERKFLSQRDLAKIANVTASTIATIELGKHHPQPRTIRAIAAALQVDPAEIEWPAISDRA